MIIIEIEIEILNEAHESPRQLEYEDNHADIVYLTKYLAAEGIDTEETDAVDEMIEAYEAKEEVIEGFQALLTSHSFEVAGLRAQIHSKDQAIIKLASRIEQYEEFDDGIFLPESYNGEEE